MELELDYQFNFKSLNSHEEFDYSEIQLCVKNIIKNEGYVKYTVNKKVFTPDGGSFLGILCEIDIKGETVTEVKETNLFLKIMTPGAQITMISLPDAYKKELYVYHELSKIFNQLQQEANIPQEERFKFVHSYDESISNAIVFQNMIKKGYKIRDRMEVLSLQYAEMAVKNLAKFHAMSFVLEARRPGYYERNIKSMNQPLNFDEDFKGFLQNMCQVASSYLDGDRRRKFEAFVPSFSAKYARYMQSKCGRDVLCHNDYRVNNILVKEEEGDIKDVIAIDYQLVYFGCPILDFMYLIFPSTDREFRKTHLTHLKKTYYTTLRTFLDRFKLDASRLYPSNEFETHFKERLDYGLIVTVVLLPLLMGNDQEAPDIVKEPMSGINFSISNKYKERIIGVVDEFIEYGLL